MSVPASRLARTPALRRCGANLVAAALVATAAAAEPAAALPPVSRGDPAARLDYPVGRPPPSWAVATAESIMARWPDYTQAYHGSWTYVHGYAFCAFARLHGRTGDRRFRDYLVRFFDRHIAPDGTLRVVRDGRGRELATTFHLLDNFLPGHALVDLHEQTGEPRHAQVIATMRGELATYPRNSDGGFWHSRRMPGQMWIDSVFMGQMFVARLAATPGAASNAWDEVVHQLLVYARRAERGDSGLLVHGIYEPVADSPAPRWADPVTGLSPEVWSEGLGWFSLMLVEALAGLPAGHWGRAEVVALFRRHAAGLRRTQDRASGRWFQVVDKGDRSDNWTDSSGTAMFTYALQRGIELGLLERETFAPVVARGYAGVLAFATINERGLVDVREACDGLGVQADYRRYIERARVLNAREAVISFLWVTELMERPRP